MRGIITVLIILINTVGAYGVAFNICRIDETGTIISGPVDLDSQAGVICKVSEAGYVYTYDEYDFRCFDSTFNLINAVDSYGPTLNLIDEFGVPGYPYWLTVDQLDGSIWYSTGSPGEYAIYKVTRDGDLVYYFPDEVYRGFTEVSPDGYFWGYESVYSVGLRLWDTEGNIHAEAAVECGWELEIYFGDSSCWFLTDNPKGIGKVNSSGSVVYNNPTDFDRPRDLAIDQTDGSVWIADTYNYDIVHLDQNGTELLRTDWDEELIAIAVDPTNDTVLLISTPAHAKIEPTSVGRIKALFE
jgi:hypothetical protein